MSAHGHEEKEKKSLLDRLIFGVAIIATLVAIAWFLSQP